MWTAMVVIGFFATIAAIIGTIVVAFKHTGTWKKWLAGAGVAFIVLMVGAVNAPHVDNKQAATSQQQIKQDSEAKIKQDTSQYTQDPQPVEQNKDISQTKPAQELATSPETTTSQELTPDEFKNKSDSINTTTQQPASQPITQQVPGKKYVGSTDQNKYHYPDCRWAKKINPANQIWFTYAADAHAHGYVACKVCKP